MAGDDEDFLSRWSRLKREEAEKPPQPAAAGTNPAAVPAAGDVPPPPPAQELPPVESLTLESDYRAFLQPNVSPELRRTALKKLFGDPHFHFDRMDKLDTYIDDYSIEDPISDEMMKTLDHARHILFDDRKPPAKDDAAVAAADNTEADAPPAAIEPRKKNDDPRQDS